MCDLDGMCQPRAEQVAFMVDEDLGLVFEPAKGGGMNDAVAITLEFAAMGRRRFRVIYINFYLSFSVLAIDTNKTRANNRKLCP